MNNSFEILIPIIGVIMSLAIPMLLIVFVAKMHINAKNREKEVRQLIIENNVDAERAKLLLTKAPREQGRSFFMLRLGCFFAGAGLGALLNYLLGQAADSFYFYLILAFGCGVGMLIEFLIEWKLGKSQPES